MQRDFVLDGNNDSKYIVRIKDTDPWCTIDKFENGIITSVDNLSGEFNQVHPDLKALLEKFDAKLMSLATVLPKYKDTMEVEAFNAFVKQQVISVGLLFGLVTQNLSGEYKKSKLNITQVSNTKNNASGGKPSSSYITSKQTYVGRDGVKRRVYIKGSKTYVKKRDTKTGKMVYKAVRVA